MVDGTGFRLDTADLADGSGWRVKSKDHTDLFTKDRITIEVQYSSNDDIETIVRRGPTGEFETVDHGHSGNLDLLR